jgi:hypothetical protein
MNILPTDNDLYPSYKSFDSYVDVGRLRALDEYLHRKISTRAVAQNDALVVKAHGLDEKAPYQPAFEVWLTRTLPGTPYDYLDIDSTELWRETPRRGVRRVDGVY